MRYIIDLYYPYKYERELSYIYSSDDISSLIYSLFNE